MAAPLKEGLNYFPLDTNMEKEVAMLEAKHDLPGFAVYIKLLQEAYKCKDGELCMKDQGGVSLWLHYSKLWHIRPEKLKEILKTMLKLKLFDENIYRQKMVITSHGIKKRIEQIQNERNYDRNRKKDLNSPDELQPYSDRNTGGLQNNPTGELGKERKGKETKGKEVQAAWNSFATQNGLHTILALTQRRINAITARSKDSNFDLDKAFEKIKKTPFCLGDNNRGWKANFDWLFLQVDAYYKLMEGAYDSKPIEHKTASIYPAKPKTYKCDCGKELLTSQKYSHESGECPIHKPADPEAVKRIVEEAERSFEKLDNAQTPEEIHEIVNKSLGGKNV